MVSLGLSIRAGTTFLLEDHLAESTARVLHYVDVLRLTFLHSINTCLAESSL